MNNVDNPFQSPAILSLCPGMLGLEEGLEAAIGPLRTIAYVEIEAFVDENLVSKMEQGLLAPAPIWTDVKTFPSHILRGKVHGITGGYPCQPFSVAGKQLGKEDPRHLWPYIGRGEASIVGTIRPVWCLFENVPGHLELGYREVKSDLEALGYTVEEGIFSAEEVGAPHVRKRLFILAVENSARERWRGRYHVGADGRWSLQAQGPGELDNSGSHGPEPNHQISAGWNCPQPAGQMANASHIWEQQQEGQFEESGRRFIDSGELANNPSLRLQGPSPHRRGSFKAPKTQKRGRSPRKDAARQILANSNLCRQQSGHDAGVGRLRKQTPWPSRPGQHQHPWEPPRTVESRMGYVAHGYNFREDLLRMAGNAVVRQTAELATKVLLAKHGIIV